MLVLSIIMMLFYLAFLIWLASAIYYSKSPNIIASHPNVSIVVAAHNEEKNLPLLLDALVNQNYPIDKYEIIIADDRSTDNSQEIVNFFQSKHPNINLINIKETPVGWSNKKWALTKAISKSNSDIIIQTDADCIPSLNWIKTIASYFNNSKVGFVAGASPLTHSDLLLNNLFQMESLIQEAVNAGAIKNKIVLSCTGRNIAFRKKHFDLVDGYIGNENILSGDDDLLLQKFANQTDSQIEYSIDSNSLVESPAPNNFKSFLKQRLRFASKGIDYYRIGTTLELRGTLILLLLSNGIFIWSVFNLFILGNLFYIIPIGCKALSDFFLSSIFINKLKREWSFISYLILTMLHPFYIVTIGLLGPLIKVNWK